MEGTVLAVWLVYDVAMLLSLVAVADGSVVGALTYLMKDDTLEIVSFDADPPGQGVGRGKGISGCGI